MGDRQRKILERTLIKLPEPMFDSKVSVEAALRARKSIRSYQGEDLTIAVVSQLLWAGQGISRKNGMRTAPSAGVLYPLELYLVAWQIEKIPVGIYKYRIQGHELVRISDEEHASMEREPGAMSIWRSAMLRRISICRPQISNSAL